MKAKRAGINDTSVSPSTRSICSETSLLTVFWLSFRNQVFHLVSEWTQTVATWRRFPHSVFHALSLSFSFAPLPFSNLCHRHLKNDIVTDPYRHHWCNQVLSLPLGERYFFPSCPWHAGHSGLRWPFQLLGQRRKDQVEDLGAARPAHHGLLLQPQWQHLCICFQLRLVEGRRTWEGLPSTAEKTSGMRGRAHVFSDLTSSGPWVLQPPEEELHLPEERCWGAEATEQEMVREGQPLSVNMEAVFDGGGCPTSSLHLWLTVEPLQAHHDAWHARMSAVGIDRIQLCCTLLQEAI